MTAPVDVLAVLDRAIAGVEGPVRERRGDAIRLIEARAAVAELIEAADGVLHWQSGDGRPERQRLRAAVARAGGAA